jgi:hypothetical protein
MRRRCISFGEEEVSMTTINRMWWDHLVPKEMASRRDEFQELRREFRKTGYGAHWMRTALTPGGLMRFISASLVLYV